MINVHAIYAETRLSQDQHQSVFGVKKRYHPGPFSIEQILLIGTSNALRLVQTEQTIIELTHNILCRKEIVEHPLFPECADISPENGCGVWSEPPRLVDCDENVF